MDKGKNPVPVSSREALQSWHKAFTDEDTGICFVIAQMLRDFEAFSIAVKIVKLSGEKKRHDLNKMLFNTLRRTYMISFFALARRLLDNHTPSVTKEVHSLKSVLKTAEAYLPTISRAEYVEHMKSTYPSSSTVWAHLHFDKLSETRPGERSLTDYPKLDLIKELQAELDTLNWISVTANKLVLHSSTAKSRDGVEVVEEISLAQCADVLKLLTSSANRLSLPLAGRAIMNLPELGNRLEGLDKPLVDSEELPALEASWREMHEKIGDWLA